MIKTIAINTLITMVLLAGFKVLINTDLNERANETADYLKNYPKIKVVNIERVTAELLNNELSMVEVAEYAELLIKSMAKKNYLVIDANSIISQPARMKLNLITLEQLRNEAEKLGVTDKSDYDKLLKAERDKIDAIINVSKE